MMNTMVALKLEFFSNSSLELDLVDTAPNVILRSCSLSVHMPGVFFGDIFTSRHSF